MEARSRTIDFEIFGGVAVDVTRRLPALLPRIVAAQVQRPNRNNADCPPCHTKREWNGGGQE